MKTIITLLTISFMNFAEEAKPRYSDFVREFRVQGIGLIKMEYKYTGEPVSRPAGASFWVKCGKATQWEPVGKYVMCDLTDYKYEPEEKKILLKYREGRVLMPTGEVVCDRLGEGEIDAKTLCK